MTDQKKPGRLDPHKEVAQALADPMRDGTSTDHAHRGLREIPHRLGFHRPPQRILRLEK